MAEVFPETKRAWARLKAALVDCADAYGLTWRGFWLGFFVGAYVMLGAWAYWDFQPRPKPEWISCSIGDGPHAGEDCPPLKLGADGYWHDAGLEFVKTPSTE